MQLRLDECVDESYYCRKVQVCVLTICQFIYFEFGIEQENTALAGLKNNLSVMKVSNSCNVIVLHMKYFFSSTHSCMPFVGDSRRRRNLLQWVVGVRLGTMSLLLGGTGNVVLCALGLAGEGAVVLDLLLAFLLLASSESLLGTFGYGLGGVAGRVLGPRTCGTRWWCIFLPDGLHCEVVWL